MPIQTSCPGCGGPLYVEDKGGIAVCQFCGTRFKVDMDGVAPTLAIDSTPAELSETPTPEEPFTVQEEWHPPQPEPPEVVDLPSSAKQPVPGPAHPVNQLFGGKLWLVITLVVGAILIVSCVCIYAAYRLLLGVGSGIPW